MTISKFSKVLKNDCGAVLVEVSLLLPLLLLLTFGIVEGGYIFYQANGTQKATQLGARFAATRPMIATGFTSGTNDCMSSAAQEDIGTNCATVPPANLQSVTCSKTMLTGCDDAKLTVILNKMKSVYPFIEDNDLFITYEGTGLGFVGRGKPVPAITVELRGVEYDYIAIGHLLNFSGVDLGSAFKINNVQTTVIGEDIGEGSGGLGGGTGTGMGMGMGGT